MVPEKKFSKDSEELQAFLSVEEMAPPAILTEKIFAHVGRELNPSVWKVFSRVAAIHTVVGALSLVFVCPQFGISPLGHTAVMEWFMQFGMVACMLGCGAVFLGGSAFAMGWVLRPEEIRVIRQTRLLQLGTLTLLSIGAFLCLGASVVASLGFFWLLGSLLGGLASLELGWILRRRLVGTRA